MIDHFGLVAKRIADMKAEIIGVPGRIVLDGLRIVDMRDDRYGLAGFCRAEAMVSKVVRSPVKLIRTAIDTAMRINIMMCSFFII